MANFEDFPPIFCPTADFLPQGGGPFFVKYSPVADVEISNAIIALLFNYGCPHTVSLNFNYAGVSHILGYPKIAYLLIASVSLHQIN